MKLSHLFILAFCVSFFMIIFGQSGLVSAYKKSQIKANLYKRIKSLQKENKLLTKNIQSFHESSDFAEYVVRNKLSLVQENEIIFEFK